MKLFEKNSEFYNIEGQIRKLPYAAEFCCQNFNGDLVEIGCLRGSMTLLYAKVAKKYNRKVWAIDPWYEDNKKYDKNLQGFYDEFLEKIKDYKDYVEIIKASSLDKDTIKKIKNIDICFASVDGLHTKDACYSDIMSVSHCSGVIAVDDVIDSRGEINWQQKMRDAIGEAMIDLKDYSVVWPTEENKIEKNAYIYIKIK
jgi:predicted O-methyltransferase YrrM